MIHDSVREELVGKISNAAKPLDFQLKGIKMTQNKPTQSVAAPVAPKPDVPPKTTTEIPVKPPSPPPMNSSPPVKSSTLEFHSKNATVPEWRLQLQNVVRQRQEREMSKPEMEIAPPIQRAQLNTNGATALKERTIAEPETFEHKNPTLNSALERIEKSRQQFLAEEKKQSVPAASPVKANKNYPFYIAAKTSEAVSKPAEANTPISSFAKPKLASSLRAEKDKLDTNKLPPLPLPPPASVATSFETRPVVFEDVKKPPIAEAKKFEPEVIEVVKVKAKTVEAVEVVEPEEVEVEEYDDCAPFSMRFNAGLFDLIIGSFSSLLLLSPFMILGGNWLSTAGLFAFLATCAVVMFIYLTTSVGFYGRTFGMRLFSLEIIDIKDEEYPTFHQSAVSSAVYLLSLALGGIGFLTLLFNEDKRAVHDLVSGTIMVKE
jgi:uncharacterized RDD family membrane protein YckC